MGQEGSSCLAYSSYSRVFSLVSWAIEITETLLGCIFLLTKIGVQFHDRFAVSATDFLTFLVCWCFCCRWLFFFPKGAGFFHFLLPIFCWSMPSASWTVQVLCKGIDVPQLCSLVVSEPPAPSVARVWLPVLQPYLAAVEIRLILLKEIVVHLLLVCALISMRV